MMIPANAADAAPSTAARAVPPGALHLWMLTDPAKPLLVGTLTSLTNGDAALTYSDNWVQSGFALSADMPLGAHEHRPGGRPARKSASAAGAVDDARPDQWGEKVIRTLHKPRGNRLLDYLYFAGDNRFGALGISTSAEHYLPSPGVLPTLADAPALSEVAKAISAGQEIGEQRRTLAQAGGSLGGAKPKAAISVNGQPHLLKFFNGEPVDNPLIEHAAMTLAAKAGISVAPTFVVKLPGEHALAVERFDRSGSARLHCISAATVLRAEHPAAPQFGYPHLARVLRRSAAPASAPAQLRELFRRMVFNILIANTDDHEKNHALIVRADGVLELSKAYDIVPTGSGAVEHQLLIGEDSHEARLDLAMQVCGQFALSPPAAAEEIAAVIGVVDGWQDHFRQCGVTGSDIAELTPVIDRHDLLRQRRSFDAAAFATAAPVKRRRNPFADAR